MNTTMPPHQEVQAGDRPAVDPDALPARRARNWRESPTSVAWLPEALPERELTQDELSALVGAVAAEPGRWAHHLAFDEQHRQYALLHRDAFVDIWVLCWTPSNDTGWHDHDMSSGAVAVTRGRLVEHNLGLGQAGAQDVATVVEDGRSYSFGPDHIHRLTGLDAGTVSIHAYSPPLWRMGQYSLAGGVLRRRSVSYADELRPVDGED